jgi:hypothetical protein
MSLRGFHLLFIALSVVLAGFCAAWAVGQYRAGHQVEYAIAGTVSVIASAGLVVYGAAFERKTRRL